MPSSAEDLDPAHPELHPPFLQIPGLANVRDIGNWPIPPSSFVRPGILYRSSDPTTITPRGIATLHSLSITTIFDLRSTPQIVRAGGVREIEGIKRVWCPVFGEEEYTVEKAGMRYLMYSSEGTEGIVQAFIEILLHGAIPSFRPILLHLASRNPDDGACMMHCTTGNNRSGVFISVLLSLLGVRTEDVAAEYALSEVGLRGERDGVVERLLRNEKFREACGGGEVGRERARRMVGARGESVVALMEEVGGRWEGGSEGYVREVVGLSGEEVEGVRRVMTEDKVVR